MKAVFLVSCCALLLPGGIAGAANPQPSRDCIATYDKQGHVTGRYCSDGSDDGADLKAMAPEAEDLAPGEDEGSAAPAKKLRASPTKPHGVDIECGRRGHKRCRGTFAIGR